MKNLKYIFNAFCVVATLAGCGATTSITSGWHQDPLDGKDGAFKNGQQKPVEGEKPIPEDEQSVRLDNDGARYVFTEGTEGVITLTGRILKPGYAVSIYIDNASDFPNYKFDAAKGEFKWTPALGTITPDVGDTEVRKPLKVHVVGKPASGAVVSREFDVDLRVSKVFNAPEIFQVSKTQADLREGDMTTISVKVRDKDAGNDVRSYPNLQILPITGYANLSQYVTITQVLATGNNEFVINLSVDLTDAELTKSRDRYGFTIKAVSRYQRASTGTDVFINVMTSFGALQTTWFDTIDVPTGAKKEFQFMVFDPKDELWVKNVSFTNVPSGADITCKGVGVTRQFCTFTWTPDFQAPQGPVTIQATATATNQDTKDTLTKNYNFDLKLNVTSAPPVSPLARKGVQ